jgi:anaerobic magnesium-protoporphyrin IX monomethyl ester cyclase
MAYCHNNFGSRFIWLTDDNFGIGEHGLKLAEEIIQKRLSKDFMWFTQMRCDDVVKHQNLLPKLRESGLRWVLLGIESSETSTLETFKKGISPKDAIDAVKLLKQNDIFAQAMFIIGERKDTAKSIAKSRDFMELLDPDFVIYAILTPFPGTQLYEEAKNNGWINDSNWSNYDMVHAIMPTETLSRKEVQEELYACYRRFYGSWKRRVQGLFSRNRLKRRVYWYMMGRGIINKLEGLVNTFET